MNISISNIAWNRNDDTSIAALLRRYDITGIEISPTKVWDNPVDVTAVQAQEYKTFWANQGIAIIAMQSLLYNRPELTLFDTSVTREKTLDYLTHLIKLASWLGIPSLIFGAPFNRKKGTYTTEQANEIAQKFFYTLAQRGKDNNVFICLEAIPTLYECDYITTTQESINLVIVVNHAYFKLHIDTGTIMVNNEDISKIFAQGMPFLRHLHIAEKNLAPIYNLNTPLHRDIADILRTNNYPYWVSLEIRGSNNVQAIIEPAIVHAKKIYG